MIPMTIAEIADVVRGKVHADDPDAVVSAPAEYDSRKLVAGGLFAAFVGEHLDGHDFAAQAVAQGAAAVLGSRPVDGVPMIVVSDPLDALAKLARVVLERLPQVTVIGVTGSSGKTTTKDLIGQLLRRLGPTVAPPGSLNNELGLPHTVLSADADTRFLVLEMGARGPGHISHLCAIAPPRIGVVVNVGVAHIGEFGSVDGIGAAKSELVKALPADGLAVLNGDDPRVAAMAGLTHARVAMVGQTLLAPGALDSNVPPSAAEGGLVAVDVALDERGRPSYTLVDDSGRQAAVTLQLNGVHQVGNSLLAAAVAVRCGMLWSELPSALADLRGVSTRRMDVFDRADDVTVIDDSYNANPASMAAALRALIAIGQGRRTVAVLGYMAELGESERDGHAEVGALAATLGVDLLIAVGESTAPILDGATTVAQWEGESVLVNDQAAAIGELRRRMRPRDVVLVKGSRYRTWEVVDALRQPLDGPLAVERAGR
jgi:UDP-N-acetylmuramoyl-tripeptide--D-alanyl-D-alanine ligase